jgi:hypothetical protein
MNLTALRARDAVMESVRERAENAKKTNKPMMWAYLVRMFKRLDYELGPADMDHQVIVKCQGIVQDAADQCPRLVSHGDNGATEAADLWALSVYATRILTLCGRAHTYSQADRSLDWLHDQPRLVPYYQRLENERAAR